MRPGVGFSVGSGGGVRKTTADLEHRCKSRRLPNKHHTVRRRPNASHRRALVSPEIWRPIWVFTANYGALTLHALCMRTTLSPKSIRFSLGSTITRSRACANILTRRFPALARPPPRFVAICRIAAILTYWGLYTFQTRRPILLRLLQAATYVTLF